MYETKARDPSYDSGTDKIARNLTLEIGAEPSGWLATLVKGRKR